MWIEIKVKKITFRLSSVPIFDSLFSFLYFFKKVFVGLNNKTWKSVNSVSKCLSPIFSVHSLSVQQFYKRLEAIEGRQPLLYKSTQKSLTALHCWILILKPRPWLYYVSNYTWRAHYFSRKIKPIFACWPSIIWSWKIAALVGNAMQLDKLS